MTFLKQHGPLIISLLVIGGIIFYFQSQKPMRGNIEPGVSDILVEDTLVGTSSETTNPTTAQTIREQDRIARIALKAKKYERVKEISTPDGFINTDPFLLKDYVGKKVILVDFWTYSCINCKRTTPYLNAWYDKYEKDGLVIVGIHTPEFDFEKVYDNVKKAVAQENIKYPVVLDNDYSTWTAYKNQYWPRKYLIDIDGFIVYDHIGEGGYDETEKNIVNALNERAKTLGANAITMDGVKLTDVVTPSLGTTPETYLGWGRLQYMENSLPQNCYNVPCTYEKPTSVSKNKFALSGTWRIKQEFASTESGGGSVTFSVRAKNVYVVAHGTNGPVEVEILLDGKPVSSSLAGTSVTNGKMTVGDAKLYHILSLPGVEEHTLELKSTGPGFELFTFTFG